MNAIAWTLTALLVAAFLGAAVLKTLLAKPALREKGLFWVDDFSQGSVRGIAFVEFVGACGLILPWALNTLRILTPISALGLAVVMAGALVVHLRRHENKEALPPIILAVCAAASRYYVFDNYDLAHGPPRSADTHANAYDSNCWTP